MTDIIVLSNHEDTNTPPGRWTRETLFVRRGDVQDEDLELVLQAIHALDKLTTAYLSAEEVPRLHLLGAAKDWTGPTIDWSDLIDDAYAQPVNEAVRYEMHLAAQVFELVGRMASVETRALFTKRIDGFFPGRGIVAYGL